MKESMRRARSAATPPEPAFDRLVRRRERKQRNGRIASAAVALVVVAGVVAGGVWTLEHRSSRAIAGSSGPSGPSATGAPSPGAISPSLVAGPGQYYYWKTVRPTGEGGNVVEELWWSQDGSGRYLVDHGNPNYGTPNSQTWGPGGPPVDMGFPFETDLSGLSTVPATLLQQLLDRSSENGSSPEPDVTIAPGVSPETSRLWRSIQNMLEQGEATAPLRAALFEVASGLDGITVRDGAGDPLGRPAITVSVPLGDYYCSGGPGGTDIMWFDPQTHLLLASNGDLGCSPSMLVVAGGIVDSTSDTVAPGDGYVPAPVSDIPEPTRTTTVPGPEPSIITASP
ncbi:MAG: hypothetical protein M3Q23_04180 [Actinomycetota bacterium]|nr:hypothetical protein [Actinomycetota bacterium]